MNLAAAVAERVAEKAAQSPGSVQLVTVSGSICCFEFED